LLTVPCLVVPMALAILQLGNASALDCGLELNAAFVRVRRTAMAMAYVPVKEYVTVTLAGSVRIVPSTNAIKNASMAHVTGAQGSASAIQDISLTTVAKRDAVERL